MSTKRNLDTATLDLAAAAWAGEWFRPTVYSRQDATRPTGGRGFVVSTLYGATFKDEHEYLLKRFRASLGADPLKEFDKLAAERFTPRDDAVFEQLLAEKLAINPAGEHIKGKVGSTIVGGRVAGMHTIEVETPESIRYRRVNRLAKADHRRTYLKVVPNKLPIHAGEVEEHGHHSIADFIRDQAGATVMNVSAEIAILGLDALVGGLDEGAGAATIDIRSGSQPVDPDAATTGTRLAALVMQATAFLGAADQGDGTIDVAADTIADDTSADATGTAGYFRVGATTTPPTLIDDHIDGECGTSGADMNFNTVAIVSGAVVEITSYVITQSQGSTAT